MSLTTANIEASPNVVPLLYTERNSKVLGAGDAGGGGGGMSEIERRVSVLESELTAIRGDLTSVRIDIAKIAAHQPNLATREDLANSRRDAESIRAELHKAISDSTRTFVLATLGLMISLLVGLFTIVRSMPQAPMSMHASQSPQDKPSVLGSTVVPQEQQTKSPPGGLPVPP